VKNPSLVVTQQNITRPRVDSNVQIGVWSPGSKQIEVKVSWEPAKCEELPSRPKHALRKPQTTLTCNVNVRTKAK
jgi:hypothetical protein